MTRRNTALAASAAAFTLVAMLAGCTSTGGTTATGPSAVASASSAAAAAHPSVSTVSPASAGLVGGETATITGTGLSKVTAVTFNGVAATSVTVVSPTEVTAVVPSAVNYQPSSGAVVVTAGTTVVPSASTVSYSWTASTPVDKEMQYAFAHWDAPTYNTAYYDFNAIGGDCQNFVSQSLLAAGFATSSSWYYTSQSNHSTTWGYAPAFNSYLAANPSLGFTRLNATQESQVQVGDLAYFDWNGNGVPDHTMVVSSVTTVNGQVDIKLAGHNIDGDYRDLQTILQVQHPGGVVWFWKLPASLRG